MAKDNKAEKTKSNPLDELTAFLDEKKKAETQEVKPEPMSDIEKNNFYNTRILPVFKKIKQKLEPYNFERVDYDIYNIVARFRISDPLHLFFFKVEIMNGSRQVRISCDLKYRLYKRKKLNTAIDIQPVWVGFNEMDKINEEFLLTLFTKWYMSKDELIQKTEDWKAKKETNSLS